VGPKACRAPFARRQSKAASAKRGRGGARTSQIGDAGGARELFIQVPDRWISGKHARMSRVFGRWVIEDLGSRNGTTVNGQPAARAVLDEVPAIDLDYLEVRDPELGPPPPEGAARLLIAAREDEAFGQRVRFLLRLPGPQRTSLVNTALHEMTLRGEPQSLREAFAVLATDTGAAAALRALDSA